MIKLTILYRKPDSLDAFEEFYAASLALMERLPHVIRRQAGLVVGAPGGESPYYRVLELYFDDMAHLETAMRGPEGEAAGRHLMEHAAALVEMYFAEVYEEAGGATPVQESAPVERPAKPAWPNAPYASVDDDPH